MPSKQVMENHCHKNPHKGEKQMGFGDLTPSARRLKRRLQKPCGCSGPGPARQHCCFALAQQPIIEIMCSGNGFAPAVTS